MTPNFIMSLPLLLLLIFAPTGIVTTFYAGFLVTFNFMSGVMGLISLYTLTKAGREDVLFKIPPGHKPLISRLVDIGIMCLLYVNGYILMTIMQVLYFALLEGVFATIETKRQDKIKAENSDL